MNEYGYDIGSNEVADKAIELTINRADKLYDGFTNKGYNNDTAAEFTKKLLAYIYNDAAAYVSRNMYEQHNSERGRNGI